MSNVEVVDSTSVDEYIVYRAHYFNYNYLNEINEINDSCDS